LTLTGVASGGRGCKFPFWNLFGTFLEQKNFLIMKLWHFDALWGGENCGFSLGMATVEPISTCWRAGKRLLIEIEKGF
jgi:hypothetical protein